MRGIPFDDNTFDVVYHSHFLEHLDREAAASFLLECHRVLKPGGTLRVVVPDLELLVKWYWESLDELDRGNTDAESRHERVIYDLFDQMVRRSSSGTAGQKPWVRRIERVIRGNAAATGENHRWMYDRYSLGRMLTRLGFTAIRVHSASTSSIAGWERCFLDYDPDGKIYKPESLYVEGMKGVR
jgi:predicted SAM-dependent methyltransferase